MMILSEKDLKNIDGGIVAGMLGFGVIGTSIGALIGSGVAIYDLASGKKKEDVWKDFKAGLITGATVGASVGSVVPV